MSYIPKHFETYELVPKAIFEAMGDSALLLMRDEILQTVDAIREFFDKPVTVNNWMDGGDFQYRGFRPAYCTIGGELSMHRVGGAIDCDIKDVKPEEARQAIIRNTKKFPLLTRMEAGVPWLHIDCKKTGFPIQLFKG